MPIEWERIQALSRLVCRVLSSRANVVGMIWRYEIEVKLETLCVCVWEANKKTKIRGRRSSAERFGSGHPRGGLC